MSIPSVAAISPTLTPVLKRARTASSSTQAAKPPIAKKERVVHSAHGDQRSDDYHWMRDTKNPAFVNFLNEWNTFTNHSLAPLAPFTEQLYREMTGRIEKSYSSVPFKVGSYSYFSRYVENCEYPEYCRMAEGSSEVTVILDSNILAEKMRAEDPSRFPQFHVLSHFPSNDGKYLALAIDRDGSRFGCIYILDLTTGSLLNEILTDSDGDFEWNSLSTGIWYTQVNEVKRSDKIKFHQIGTDPSTDSTLFHEPIGQFVVGLKADKIGQKIFITTKSKDTSEVRIGKLDDPTSPLQVILPKEEGFLYRALPCGNDLYFLTNNPGENTALYRGVIGPKSDWELIEPASGNVDNAEVFEHFIVLQKRQNGLPFLEVIDLKTKDRHRVSLPQEIGEVDFYRNFQFSSDNVIFTFESPISPSSVYKWNMKDKSITLLRQMKAGGFKTDAYTLERISATAKDGTQIPITVYHKKGLPRDGTTPMHLYGYGAYGITTDPFFSIACASLLERGVCCAIAHVRGSGDCGFSWYEGGRMLNKRNTFTDFIDCAETLIDRGYTSASKLAIRGGSAGGLLMGAVINMRPDLFSVCVAEVPFVDVLTTMFDKTLPLTEEEWVEWGNPNIKEFYDYMKSYSPYDNVKSQNYPSLLVTSNYHDHQVSVHEPAKWVAKLTEFSTSIEPPLFRIEMNSGHGGDSGRYAIYKEFAIEFAFILSRLGLTPAAV